MLPLDVVVRSIPEKTFWDWAAEVGTLLAGVAATYAVWKSILESRKQENAKKRHEERNRPVLKLREEIYYNYGFMGNINMMIGFGLSNVRSKSIAFIRYAIFDIAHGKGGVGRADCEGLIEKQLYGKHGDDFRKMIPVYSDSSKNQIPENVIFVDIIRPTIRYVESNVEILLLTEVTDVDGNIGRDIQIVHYSPTTKMITQYGSGPSLFRMDYMNGENEDQDMPSMIYAINDVIDPIVYKAIEGYFDNHIDSKMLTFLAAFDFVETVGKGRRTRLVRGGKTEKKKLPWYKAIISNGTEDDDEVYRLGR